MSSLNLKALQGVQKPPEVHWVGDGFPVRSIFSYNDLGRELSPFLMLDHVAPTVFPPADKKRGVGAHPHKGFETVTVVYQGEVEHRDSGGGGGVIGPGDVQWMTAGKGIIHEEFHSHDFTRSGGTFEILQLWVNLPSENKEANPAYQTLKAEQIPEVALEGGTLRVIAGQLGPSKGPAKTFTEINLWDVRADGGMTLPVPEGHTTCLIVLSGRFQAAERILESGELAIFSRKGEFLEVKALEPSRFFLMTGQPIHEPIVGRGPFVMNTSEEIIQAFEDYKHGRMGRLTGAD